MSTNPPTAADGTQESPPDPTDSPTAGDANVHQRVAAIIRDMPGIGKDHQMKGGQSYAYRSIEDIKAALAPLLGKHGVHYAPHRIVSVERSERPWGSKATIHQTGIIRVRFRVYGANGDHFDVEAEGEGMDTADKTTNKLHTGAEKVMLIETFCVADGDRDPDHDRIEGDRQGVENGAAEWGTVKQAKFALRQAVDEALSGFDPTEAEAKAATGAAWAEVGFDGPDGEGGVTNQDVADLLRLGVPIACLRFDADRAHDATHDRAQRALADVDEQARTAQEVIAANDIDEQ